MSMSSAGRVLLSGAAALGVMAWATAACAQFVPPGNATFSVNLGGPSELRADLIYINFDGPPVPVGGGGGVGAGQPGDDLDGYAIKSGDDFIVCVSVDPATVGKGGPFDGPLPPYNVFNQSERRQHAGDAFVGSEAYNRLKGIYGPPISTGLNTNFLSVNQSPVYFRNFNILPFGSPDVQFQQGTPADDVDGVGRIQGTSLGEIFFTMSRESPSLGKIAGAGADSGADIFFDADATNGGNEEFYANAELLGLTQQDDIDGLAVFDTNGNHRFDGDDQVLFSLTRDSPTLKALELSPADILSVRFGSPTPTTLVRFNQVGLLFTDDVDAFGLLGLVGGSAMSTIVAYTPSPGAGLVIVLAGALGAGRRRR